MKPEVLGVVIGTVIIAPLEFYTYGYPDGIYAIGFVFVLSMLLFAVIRYAIDKGWIR
jgi:hypothetical protein